jgi:peptidoglycan DL-endopeptidase CwlO
VRNRLPAMATRASIVAASAAAAAAFAVLPAQSPAAPNVPGPTVPGPTVPGPPVPGPPVPGPTGPAPAVSTPVVLTSAGSPAAKRSSAVRNALSKVGSPYRYGAAGPHAFDCSGLVTWAFKNAGTSLPRTSRAMSAVGKSVSKSDLQPGDLVFFYKPVSHVGIYIGDGKIVHASNRKSPVKVSSMGAMPFITARRV